MTVIYAWFDFSGLVESVMNIKAICCMDFVWLIPRYESQNVKRCLSFSNVDLSFSYESFCTDTFSSMAITAAVAAD